MKGLNELFLWIEGVNFSKTIYDTEDVSTIRGSSMFLEELADRVHEGLAPAGCILEDFGASRAVLSFREERRADVDAALQKFLVSEPWKHFCLTHGFGSDLASARSAARMAQLGNWSIPLSGPAHAEHVDALDHTRPATREETGPDGSRRWLSPSVAVRRANGRRKRPSDFASPLVPPPSFEDIVGLPADLRMPEVVRGKLAVVVADGIGIGKLASTFPEGPEFARAMRTYRERLSQAVVDWVQHKDRGKALVGTKQTAGGSIVFPRFDILVWGGDDVTFVLPASHLLEFVELLLSEFGKPFAEGRGPLAHCIGCVIANYKAPIRQVRAIASDAESRLKAVQKATGAAGQSMVSIDIFESAALPHDRLGSYRSALYGPGNHDADHAFAASDFRRLREFLEQTICDEGTGCIAPSKLHDVLRAAGRRSLGSAGTEVMRELEDHFAGRGEDNPARSWVDGFTAGSKKLPVFLAQMAQLHPYAQVSP